MADLLGKVASELQIWLLLASLPFVLLIAWPVITVVWVSYCAWNVYWQCWKVEWLPARGKVVFVTGCDSGFGLESALLLHARGCTVAAGCLDAESAGARALRAIDSGRVVVLPLDVTDDKSVRAAAQEVERCCEANGCGLWALYNNAGCAFAGEIDWCPIEVYRRAVDVNFMGCLRVTKAVLHLIRRARGRVVTITSGISLAGEPGRSAYSAPKAALEVLMDCLRYEMAKFQVTCHTIAPGNFTGQTAIFAGLGRQFDELLAAADGRVLSDYGAGYLHAWKRRITGGYVSSAAGAPTTVVTECVAHAVLAARPRVRYNCKEWRFLLWAGAMHVLPQPWTDAAQVHWQRDLPRPATAPDSETTT